MVVGIPNVGKSTFINAFAGKACAKTGNKPGVTKGNQWIRLNKTLELLDTPGILWPKFEDQTVGLNLAFIGSINDEILNKDELAMELIKVLAARYPRALEERYQAEAVSYCKKIRLPEGIGAGGEGQSLPVKRRRTGFFRRAAILLDDFRSGRLGRITLEVPKLQGSDGNNQSTGQGRSLRDENAAGKSCLDRNQKLSPLSDYCCRCDFVSHNLCSAAG